MCEKSDNKDKVQIFFETWAKYDAGLISKYNLSILGFKSFTDLSFHIWNVFFFNMFYKCVKGEDDLPNTCDIDAEFPQNNPINWLEYYEAWNYFHIAEDESLKEYISMQLCVNDRSPSREVFVIFKKNKKDNNQPYRLVAISSCKTVFANNYNEMDWQTAKEIASISKAQKLFPFEEVSDVIFRCEQLCNWNNRDQLDVNYEHLLKDEEHKKRMKKDGEILYKEDEIKKMVMDACYISKSNYRYAYPYIFYDANKNKKETKGLKRGFFLPLIDDQDKLVLVASVVETRAGSNRYRISTLLSPDQAIKNIKRFSLIEENWIVKYMKKKVGKGVNNKKILYLH